MHRPATTLLALVLALMALSAAVPAAANTDYSNDFMVDLRIPVVFVPGIMGSTLKYLWTGEERWLGIGTDHAVLSLFPSDSPSADIVAGDAVREVPVFGKNIYKPLLDHLVALGYREYDVAGIPSRRTTGGCDDAAQRATRPNLFVFAYDWRQDNAASAAALADYLGCVHRFDPGTQVDVIAHSMGGLVSRRHILDHPGTHHVRTLLTIGTPWLGAPDTIKQLEDGSLGWIIFPVITKTTGRYVLGSFPGGLQLLPSGAYQTLSGGGSLVEKGWDLDLDGTRDESYSFANFVSVMDSRHGWSASRTDHNLGGTLAQQFHEHSGAAGNQDDWRTDTTGVTYCHVVGVEKSPKTIGRAEAVGYTYCRPGQCFPVQYFSYLMVSGDGTVPRVSAEKRGSGLDYNAPGAEVYFPPRGNGSVEHTPMVGHPDVLAKIDAYLQAASVAAREAVPQTSLPADEPALYVTLGNVGPMVVRDNAGHSSEPLPGAPGSEGEVPGARIFGMGSGSSLVVLDLGGVYTIDFTAPFQPVGLDVGLGVPGSITSLTRFEDLDLPAGVAVRMTFDAAGFVDLRHDGDGNGSFETLVSPTLVATDPTAVDVDPPELTVSKGPIQGGSCQVTAAATDAGSGLKRMLFSADGSTFEPYSAPFAVDIVQHRRVWVFADDNLGNRAATDLVLVRSGDANADDAVDVSDVFYLINALFAGGPAPLAGDANGDSTVNVADVFYLINYLFAGGPAPV